MELLAEFKSSYTGATAKLFKNRLGQWVLDTKPKNKKGRRRQGGPWLVDLFFDLNELCNQEIK